jgi:nicotinic acid phosphoribosyltransferase
MFIVVALFNNNGSRLKVTVIGIGTIFLVNKSKNPCNFTQKLIGINKGKKERKF